MTNDKRVEEIRKALDKAYSNARRHEHWHGRSGKTAGELMTEFYGDATSDLAFLLSELDRARKVVAAARNLRQFSMRKTEDLIGNLRLWIELEGALDAALSAYDAPTENK